MSKLTTGHKEKLFSRLQRMCVSIFPSPKTLFYSLSSVSAMSCRTCGQGCHCFVSLPLPPFIYQGSRYKSAFLCIICTNQHIVFYCFPWFERQCLHHLAVTGARCHRGFPRKLPTASHLFTTAGSCLRFQKLYVSRPFFF